MPQDSEDYERPISFVSQQTGVASAREVAAQTGNSSFIKVEQTVPANDNVLVPNVEQQIPLPVVLELVAMTSVDPFKENTQVRFKIDGDGDGTVDSEPVLTPRIGDLPFDPGALAPPTTVIDIDLINDSSEPTTIAAQAVFREV